MDFIVEVVSQEMGEAECSQGHTVYALLYLVTIEDTTNILYYLD